MLKKVLKFIKNLQILVENWEEKPKYYILKLFIKNCGLLTNWQIIKIVNNKAEIA